MLLSCCPVLSNIKSLQSAALSNRPLSRHSTLRSSVYGSRFGLPRDIKRLSSASNHSLPPNEWKQSELLMNNGINRHMLIRSSTDSARIASYTDSPNSAAPSIQKKTTLIDMPLHEEVEQV